MTPENFWETLAENTALPLTPGPDMPLVALVVPPSPFTVPRGWGYYLERPFEGVTYIATVLDNAGYRVRIADARYKPDPVRFALEAARGADIVGVATFEDGFPFIEEFCRLAKAEEPKRPVMLGGSLVTSEPALVLGNTAADFAVIGEGELTVLEVMAAFAAGRLAARLPYIPGVAHKDGSGAVSLNAPRVQLPDLDILPVPDFSLWGRPAFERQLIVSSARGCFKDCSFCYRTTPKLGLKSPAKLKAELALLKEKHKAEFFQFTDLTFTFSKERTLELCAALKDLRVKWWCMTRVGNVDAEVLRAMAESGCEQILYGVETLSAEALAGARKGFVEDETVNALRLTREAGITVGAAYVVGLPGETEEALKRAIEFSAGLGSPARVKYLSAIPGTLVYKDALASGKIADPLAHLKGMLARERGAYEDDFLDLSGLPEAVCRAAYKAIEANYVPGPYGTETLAKAKKAWAYPDRPMTDAEAREIVEEDARLCGGSLLK